MPIYCEQTSQAFGNAFTNRTASISTCVEWDREQSYNTIDLLSYVTAARDTGTPGHKEYK